MITVHLYLKRHQCLSWDRDINVLPHGLHVSTHPIREPNAVWLGFVDLLLDFDSKKSTQFAASPKNMSKFSNLKNDLMQMVNYENHDVKKKKKNSPSLGHTWETCHLRPSVACSENFFSMSNCKGEHAKCQKKHQPEEFLDLFKQPKKGRKMICQ